MSLTAPALTAAEAERLARLRPYLERELEHHEAHYQASRCTSNFHRLQGERVARFLRGEEPIPVHWGAL